MGILVTAGVRAVRVRHPGAVPVDTGIYSEPGEMGVATRASSWRVRGTYTGLTPQDLGQYPESVSIETGEGVLEFYDGKVYRECLRLIPGRTYSVPKGAMTGLVRARPAPPTVERSRESQVGDMSYIGGKVIETQDSSVRSCRAWVRKVFHEFLGEPEGDASMCVKNMGTDDQSFGVVFKGRSWLEGLASEPDVPFTAVHTAAAPFALDVKGVVSAHPPVPAGSQVTVYGHWTPSGVTFSWAQASDPPQNLGTGPHTGVKGKVYLGHLDPPTRQVTLVRSGGTVALISRPFPVVSRVRVLPEHTSVQFHNEAGQAVSATQASGGIWEFASAVSIGTVSVSNDATLEFATGAMGFSDVVSLVAPETSLNSLQTATGVTGPLDAQVSYTTTESRADLYSGLTLVSSLTSSHQQCSFEVVETSPGFQGIRLPGYNALSPVRQVFCRTPEPREFGLAYNPFRVQPTTQGLVETPPVAWDGGQWVHLTFRSWSGFPGPGADIGAFDGHVDDLSLFHAEIEDGVGVVTGSREGLQGGLSAHVESDTRVQIPDGGTVSYMVKSDQVGIGLVAKPFAQTVPSPPMTWHTVTVTSTGILYINGVRTEEISGGTTEVHVSIVGNLDSVKSFDSVLGDDDVMSLVTPAPEYSSGGISWVGFVAQDGALSAPSIRRSGISGDRISAALPAGTWTVRAVFGPGVGSGMLFQTGACEVTKTGDSLYLNGVAAGAWPGNGDVVLAHSGSQVSLYAGGTLRVVSQGEVGLFLYVLTVNSGSMYSPGASGTVAELRVWNSALPATAVGYMSLQTSGWRFSTLPVSAAGENTLRLQLDSTSHTGTYIPGLINM
jgi:hypothetical protein